VTSREAARISIRRSALQRYAQNELAKDNQAQAFINIVSKAVELADGLRNARAVVIDDLFAVLIGEGLVTGEGRSRGPS
jgi:hypothetical protein